MIPEKTMQVEMSEGKSNEAAPGSPAPQVYEFVPSARGDPAVLLSPGPPQMFPPQLWFSPFQVQ